MVGCSVVSGHHSWEQYYTEQCSRPFHHGLLLSASFQQCTEMERQRWITHDVKNYFRSDQRRTTDPVRAIHRNEPQNLTQAVEWQTLWNRMNSLNHLKRTRGQITQAGFTPCRPCVFSSLLSLLQTFSNSLCRTSSATSTCTTHSCLETISLSTKVEVRTE